MSGNRIREWRMARGLTTEALADTLGISKGALLSVETGQRAYNQRILEALSAALGVAPADLVPGTVTEMEITPEVKAMLAKAFGRPA